MNEISAKLNNQRLTVLIPQAQDRSVYGAVCSLGRAGHRVVLALPPLHRPPPVVRSRFVVKVLESPDPIKKFDQFKGWLAAYQKAHPDVLVFPINEAVVQAAADLRGELGLTSTFILPRDADMQVSLSKYHANQAAIQAGLRVPETLFLRPPAASDYAEIPGQQRFPCLVKWDNCQTTEGTYLKGDNRIANTHEALLEILAELRPRQCGVILQELVPGSGAGAFFYRHQGKTILKFAHRRLHEVPWTGGVSSLCCSSNDALLLERGERLLESLDYEGVAMVEFRQDAENEPHFIEINGRLWGSLTLALKAGVNFPLAMLECFSAGDTSVKQPAVSKRVQWRHLPMELLHVRSVFSKRSSVHGAAPSRVTTLLSLAWHSLAPTCSDVFWWDDPKPGLESYKRVIRAELSKVKCFLVGTHRRKRTIELKQLAEAKSMSQRAVKTLEGKPVSNILFLCYGNICRSSYAEYQWQETHATIQSLPTAESAGFHQKVERSTPERFQEAARLRGVELCEHRSKMISQVQIDQSDLVVVMDLQNWKALEQAFPTAMSKTILLGYCDDPRNSIIPDPYDQPIPAGAEAYRRIDSALQALKCRLLHHEESASK